MSRLGPEDRLTGEASDIVAEAACVDSEASGAPKGSK